MPALRVEVAHVERLARLDGAPPTPAPHLCTEAPGLSDLSPHELGVGEELGVGVLAGHAVTSGHDSNVVMAMLRM